VRGIGAAALENDKDHEHRLRSVENKQWFYQFADFSEGDDLVGWGEASLRAQGGLVNMPGYYERGGLGSPQMNSAATQAHFGALNAQRAAKLPGPHLSGLGAAMNTWKKVGDGWAVQCDTEQQPSATVPVTKRDGSIKYATLAERLPALGFVYAVVKPKRDAGDPRIARSAAIAGRRPPRLGGRGDRPRAGNARGRAAWRARWRKSCRAAGHARNSPQW
jgi:hypothetical protein